MEHGRQLGAFLRALHGCPVRERALAWHRLGPWYEVTHGLGTDDVATVRGGLAGVLGRLGR